MRKRWIMVLSALAASFALPAGSSGVRNVSPEELDSLAVNAAQHYVLGVVDDLSGK